MTAPPHTFKHFSRTVTRYLTPALLAALLMACGAKSGPEDAASSWAASSASASVAEDPAIAGAESESQPDATSQQLAPRVNPGLKRFGVTPHVNDLDTMVDRRVIRILTVYGPGRYFLEDGPQGIVQEYAQKLQKVVNQATKPAS
jgi:hypothetical protein